MSHVNVSAHQTIKLYKITLEKTTFHLMKERCYLALLFPLCYQSDKWTNSTGMGVQFHQPHSDITPVVLIESKCLLNRTSLALWRRLKGLKKQDMLPRSEEIQEQMWNKVINIHQSGKGYRAITKDLGLQRTTISLLTNHVYKWRKHTTIVKLSTSHPGET